MTGSGRPIDEQSLGELVATVTRDLSMLVRQEVELAKAEIAQEAKRAGIGAGLLGGSGLVGLVALLFFSLFLAMGIPVWGGWPYWVGFLIVFGVYAALASALGVAALAKLVRLRPPRRTIRTVRDDITWLKHPTVAPEDRDLQELRATHSS